MSSGAPIRIWNRAAGREESELVYGEGAVRFLYDTWLGRKLADGVLTGAAPSRIYGAYQSSAMSRHKIAPFIEKFKIPMEEFEDPGFRSFNDFFIRKFKPGMRPFAADPKRMAAPCEARYLAFEHVTHDQKFPVKGDHLTPHALLEDDRLAKPFEDGPLFIARLCPTDYHRFHFPDDGYSTESRRLPGRLHSVNPLALRYKDEIFATNERHVTILETANFGKLAYVEVGALCVGKIVQTHLNPAFKRGEEKGYFLFGASTVIVLGQPGRWKPDADLLDKTAAGVETLVRLGDGIA